MCGIADVKTVKSAILIPNIVDIMKAGGKVKLIVTGDSMYPFLRHALDSVVLSSARGVSVQKGDIILAVKDTGQYVLHRICKLVGNGAIYIVGDAQINIEGPFSMEHVIGIVTSVWREDNEISCSSFKWRFLSWLWILLLPFRLEIIGLYKKIRGLRQYFEKIYKRT